KDFQVFPNVVTRRERCRVDGKISRGPTRIKGSEIVRLQAFVFESASDTPNHLLDGRSTKVVKGYFGVENDNEQVAANVRWLIVGELNLHGLLLLLYGM